jgi:hypothetical protein
VFRSAGNLNIQGAKGFPVEFVGENKLWTGNAINTLWETAGSWQNPSSLTMTFVEARNIRGVFTALNQGQSVVISDSIFEGSKGSNLLRPLYMWLTNCAVCKFERNSFESLPAFKLRSESIWNGSAYIPSDLVVRDNLFIGNSTTAMSSSKAGKYGEWILANKLDNFSGNSFVDFKSAVLAQEDETVPWYINGNYFNGLTAAQAQNFISQGLVSGAIVQSVLTSPSATAPVKPSVPGTAPTPTPTAKPAPKPIKYKNCTELNKVYPGGVSKSGSSINKGGKIRLTQVVNIKVYDLNKALDRDKDGLACER